MWFECCMCEQILPIYFVDDESAKYSPLDELVCFDCADDCRREHCEEEDDGPWEDSIYISGQGVFSY